MAFKPSAGPVSSSQKREIQDCNVEQGELDLDEPEPDRSELMTVMDRLNMRYGRGTLKLVSAGTAGMERQ